jgi:hypothetical protein
LVAGAILRKCKLGNLSLHQISGYFEARLDCRVTLIRATLESLPLPQCSEEFCGFHCGTRGSVFTSKEAEAKTDIDLISRFKVSEVVFQFPLYLHGILVILIVPDKLSLTVQYLRIT